MADLPEDIIPGDSGVTTNANHTHDVLNFIKNLPAGQFIQGAATPHGSTPIANLYAAYVSAADVVSDAGGYVSGGTDVPVTDGGTGASTAAQARTNLGLTIGTDVQAHSSVLANTTASYTTAEESKLAAISGTNTGDEAAASTTTAGVIEVATPTEINAGTDDTRAVSPAGLAASTLAAEVTANTAKVSATEANVISAIDGATIPQVTALSGDFILFQDTSDGGAVKKSDVADLPGAAGGLSNVVEDATPQLGGNLDLNTFDIIGKVIGTDVQAHSAVLDATTASFTTADEAKLDELATGTDLSWDAGTRTVSSSTGSNATLSVSDGVTAGLMSVADKTALDALAAAGGGRVQTTSTHNGVGAASITRIGPDQSHELTVSANITGWTDNLTTTGDILLVSILGDGGSTSYTADLSSISIDASSTLSAAVDIHPDTELVMVLRKRGANLWCDRFDAKAAGTAPAAAWSVEWTDGFNRVESVITGLDASWGAGVVVISSDLNATGDGYASEPIIQMSPNNYTTIGDAITNGSYVEFPLIGTDLDPTTVSFNIARGGSSTPRTWALRSSADSYAATISTADIPTVRTTWTPVSVDVTSLPATSNLTFRLYGASPSDASLIDIDSFKVESA